MLIQINILKICLTNLSTGITKKELINVEILEQTASLCRNPPFFEAEKSQSQRGKKAGCMSDTKKCYLLI